MIDHEIANDVTTHANQEGSGYNYWYCGIATDPDARLFVEHNVPREEGKAWWIKRNTRSEQNARDTEDYLLNLGFDGGSKGGDNTTIHVYAYRKIPGVTREE